MGDRSIRLERARAAVQLIGEVHELGVKTEPGRQHLVQGALKLIGCAIGAAVHDRGYARGLKNGIVAATLSGFDAQIIEVFDSHQKQGSDINPYHAELMRRWDSLQGEVFTATNRELVERKVWDGSMWINEYVRPARIDHFIGSMRSVAATSGVGLGFMRQANDKPFTAEDRDVLHLVHVGVGPCFDHQSPRLTLAPRVQQTLDVLLTGATDKEIAAQLRLSPHTVRQYVKVILRAYGASNRSQLITLAS